MFDAAHSTPAASAAFADEWAALRRPGTWWTAAERLAIARVARGAWGGAVPDPDLALGDASFEAAAILGGDPGRVRAGLVDRWYSRGLQPEPYVELVGVAARVTAIDTFHRAMGHALAPLPDDPEPGEPTRVPASPPARRGARSFAPTVGPPTIPSVLSAVPAESKALWRLSDAMYLTAEEMSRPDTVKDLDRRQIEVVAARTSLHNDCFY